MDAPFIHLTWRDGRITMSGDAFYSAGHRIRRPDQSVDDGVYACWDWQEPALIVSNDRYGMRPLFYAASESDLVVSPSIETILARGVSRTLDDAAVAVFLRLNYFIGEDTPFEGIRAVPPAARFLWREGHLDIQDGRPRPPASLEIDRNAAIDEFLSRFSRAIERRRPVDGPVVLPLSGGKDSRHILFALRKADVTPTRCVTVYHYPPRNNQDAEIAARLAARVGVPHVVLAPLSHRIRAEQEKNRLTQFCSDEHVQFMSLRRHLLDCPATVYDGIAGDTLVQSWRMPESMIQAFEDGDIDEASRELLEYDAHGLEAALSKLLTETARRRFNLDLAMQRMRCEVIRHMGGANPANSFVFWNRTRREVALSPFGLLGFLPYVHAPFLDVDVYDFLVRLPVAMLSDRQFQPDALRRAYSEFTDIPFESQERRRDAAGYSRRVAADLLWLFRRRSQFVSRPFVASRAAAAWTEGRSNRLWFVGLAVWLHQIERLAAG